MVFVGSKQFKQYRGMGSLGAMQSRGEAKSYQGYRYFQTMCSATTNSCPKVSRSGAHRGKLSVVAHQLIGGLRAAMGYSGADSIAQLHAKAVSCGSRRRGSGKSPARHSDDRRGAELSPPW